MAGCWCLTGEPCVPLLRPVLHSFTPEDYENVVTSCDHHQIRLQFHEGKPVPNLLRRAVLFPSNDFRLQVLMKHYIGLNHYKISIKNDAGATFLLLFMLGCSLGRQKRRIAHDCKFVGSSENLCCWFTSSEAICSSISNFCSFETVWLGFRCRD